MRTILAGQVLLCLLFHPFPATARDKSEWSKVEAVPPGTRTTVELYKDRAPSGKRKIEGHFRSATAKEHHAPTTGWKAPHPPEAERTQGFDFSSSLEAIPRMACYGNCLRCASNSAQHECPNRQCPRINNADGPRSFRAFHRGHCFPGGAEDGKHLRRADQAERRYCANIVLRGGSSPISSGVEVGPAPSAGPASCDAEGYSP